MDYAIEHIDKTIENLGRLTPAKLNKKSAHKCPLKATIFLMAPRLLEMQDVGFTLNEIVDALKDEGIVITKATLSRYLREYRESRGETPEAAKPKRTVKKKKTSGETNESDVDTPNKKQSAKFEASDEQDAPQVQADFDEDYEPDETEEAPDESECEVVDD